MYIPTFLRFIVYLVLSLCIWHKGFSQSANYTHYVDPFIGTGGAGHTFPGALLPFGMVQLSPDTRVDGSWEGCSGYHYSDSIIYGFSHTHLSGTGASDYGDVLIMPTIGKSDLNPKVYACSFSHSSEKASPGFYEVLLNKGSIKAELSATTRVGIHRYTFPKTTKANILIDLLHRDKTLSCDLTVIDSVTVSGYRVSEAWAKEQHVYFVIKFSKPFTTKGLKSISGNRNGPTTSLKERIEGGLFQFDVTDDKPLVVKVAISQTSINGAIKNMIAEAPHWDFDTYKKDATNAWEQQLSKIEVSSQNKEHLTTFYTALYHCMIHPSVAGDVDGAYRGRDNKIHQANGFVPYTVFSLWDTFRALHPLFTLIEQKRTNDFITSFIQQYKECGRLPIWELSANETNCMIGFHSVSVIADAVTKGINGFDINEAYTAMKVAANYTDLGIPAFNNQLYLQVDDEPESVSKTLEYGYDNWCLAQVALKLNKTDDYNLFLKRAQAYKNVYDAQTGFMRPRKNGGWLSPFDPKEVNNHYTEANSWQYSFFVPQDISGLINLMGGESSFDEKLDDLFSTSSQTTGRTQADITGLIGQYAHGNEPSHHMAYLYNYIGKTYKTQEKVYSILTTLYKNTPDGLIGNDDCGQLSAWYVLSSIGLYQVCPGLPEYTIGYPLFDQVKIHLENKHVFELSKTNPSYGFEYIESVALNDKPTQASFFSHQTIIDGGKIRFTNAKQLEKTNSFGKSSNNRPHTIINSNSIFIAPIITAPTTVFNQTATVAISHPNKAATIYYTTDATEPTKNAKSYHAPFIVDASLTIKAKAFLLTDSSVVTSGLVFKKPNDWSIQLLSNYNKQYHAGGADGLIDGRHGTINWRSGEWQGYQGQNFECVIDLGKTMPVEFISSSYLQDTRSWILFPKQVDYFISTDGINYTPYGSSIENGIAPDDYSVQLRTFTANEHKRPFARYIKVKVTNYGILPSWHLGAGGEAFIFIDEIDIR